jgi:hypothetical protein
MEITIAEVVRFVFDGIAYSLATIYVMDKIVKRQRAKHIAEMEELAILEAQVRLGDWQPRETIRDYQ